MSRMKTGILVPDAQTYVKAALGSIGLPGASTRAHIATPYLGHSLLQYTVDTSLGQSLGLKVWRRIQYNLYDRSQRRANGVSSSSL